VLEVVLKEGKRLNSYNLPFTVFTGMQIGADNRFASIAIEADLAEQGATFVLEDRASKQFLQLCKIAQVAGYNIEIKLKKRTAA
jgi:hypothetical protein